MPGGALLTEDEKLQQLLSLLREDGGVPNLGRVPVAPVAEAPLYRPTDEELLHPEAATRAADAAAVAPQEYGETSATLLREPEEPEPEPMVVGIDRKLAAGSELPAEMRQMAPLDVGPPAARGDIIEAELGSKHVEHAMRRPYQEVHREVANAQAEAATPPPEPAPPPDPKPPSAPAPFNRDTRMAEARRAYEAVTDDDSNPYSPDFRRGRWEEEFLRGKDPLTDQEIRSRATMLDNWWGHGAGDKFYDREQKLRAGYDKGLIDARERDIGEMRVPPELAEALAATGNISPEGAARLKMNSQFVQAYVNGMYSQGVGSERIQRLYEQVLLTQQGSDRRAETAANTSKENTATNVAGANYRAELAAAAAERTARMRKEMGRLPEQQRAELFAANLQENLGVKFDTGVAAWKGDLTGIPPELVDQVRGELAKIKPFATATDLRPIGPGVVAAETRGNISTEQAVEKMIEMAKKDNKLAFEIQGDMLDAADKLSKGIEAWNNMSEGGQRAFATLGDAGLAAILKSGLMTENDRSIARAVWTPLNELVQKRTGVAASKYEYGRTANEMGLANGSWAPFNTPGAIEGYLNDAAGRMKKHYELYNRLLEWD